MAYTRSGTVVIQSGTNTSLSGVEAVNGVTRYGDLYLFNGVTLRVDGDLSYNGADERIRFVNTPDGGSGTGSASVYINDNAELDIRCTMGARSSFSEIPSLYPCIDFGTRNIPTVGGSNTRYNNGRKFISGHPNSTVTLEGLYVGANSNTNGVLTAMEGTTVLNNAVLAFNTDLANNQFSFINYAEFNNSVLQGGSLTDRNAQLLFNGFAVKESSEGILLGGNTAGAKTAVVVDYDPKNVVTDLRINMVGSTTNGAFILVNSAKDVNQTTYNFNDSSGFGAVLFRSTVDLSFKDVSGNPTDVSVYGIDNNGGNRNGNIILPGFPTVNSASDFIYQGDTNSGEISFEVVTGIATELNNSVNKDDRGVVPFKFVSYNSIIASTAPNLIGLGNKKVFSTALPDTLITEPSKTVASAYTSQDTAHKAYDQLKSILVDNYLGQDETIVTRTGDTLDARSLDVIINSTGVGPATLSGSTLTLNASSFVGNIVTSGTVSGSQFVEGLVTDSSGTNNLLTITNLTNSNIQVINNSNIVIDRQENVTGTYSYPTEIGLSGPHKIIINRLGYAASVINVDLQGQAYAFEGSLIQDRTSSGSAMYQDSSSAILDIVPVLDGSAMRVNVGNGTVTAQQVYDETQQALMTQDGMSYIANGGGACTIASLPTGTFLFLGDNLQLKRANTGDSSATVEAFVNSTQGTVLDRVNGAVQFVTVTRAQQLTEFSGFIWVDLLDGFDENQYPAGTPSRKTNSLANAKALADFYGINRIKVSGDSTAFPSEFTGITLQSDPSTNVNASLLPDITLTAQSGANNCIIDGFKVEGDTDVSSSVFGNEYLNCVINGLNGLNGLARGCKLAGTIQVQYSVDLVDCYGTAVIAPVGTSSRVSIPTYSGALTVAGMTSPTSSISIGVIAGTVTIDSSCTAGTIVVANADVVTDNSNGATVIILNDTSSGGGGDTAENIYTYFTSSNREDVFKADVSTLATQTSVNAIPTNPLLSTDVRIDNLDAAISSRSTFDPTADTVGRVTLVDTTTSNTDMRGTDGANTVVPDNTSISSILVDTNELQQNQGNWLTATGFATPTDLTGLSLQSTLLDVKSKTDTLINTDLTGIALSSDVSNAVSQIKGVDNKDLTEVFNNTPDVNLTPVLDAVNNLNDFDPVNDVVARVTLVDTTTINTDMRGTDGANTINPDNASISAIKAKTDTLVNTDLTGIALTSDISNAITSIKGVSDRDLTEVFNNTPDVNLTPVLDAVNSLNDFDPVNDIVSRVTLVDNLTTNNDKSNYSLSNGAITSSVVANNAFNNNTFTTGFYNTLSSSVNSTLTSSHGSGSWQQTVIGTVDSNVVSVNGMVVGGVDDFKADLSLVSTTSQLNDAVDSINNTTNTRASQSSLDSVIDSISQLPTTGSIDVLLNLLQLIIKYHDNKTSFLNDTKTSTVPQKDAYYMVVYDDDETTPLKTISFVDVNNLPTVLTEATGYIKE